MYHSGGNAFLGGPLVYLPVVGPIIAFILSYVPIGRVEGRKEKTGDMDRRGDLRCYFFNPFSVVYLPPFLASPYITYPPTHTHFLL